MHNAHTHMQASKHIRLHASEEGEDMDTKYFFKKIVLFLLCFALLLLFIFFNGGRPPDLTMTTLSCNPGRSFTSTDPAPSLPS